MPKVRIPEYTDPACPWAFSAEPFRLRLAVEQPLGHDGFWSLPGNGR